MSKLIVVFGATGLQGGGVVTALLKEEQFKVRAVTRNTTSEKAKALQSLGVEVVEGNLDDSASLLKALAGCYGVFGVTNTWGNPEKNNEIPQGKNLVDACKSSGVKHLIFSGLDSVKDSIGKECPDFDGKNEVEKYMFASGLPSTSVRYAAYMQNMLNFFPSMTQKNSDGKLEMGIPMEGKPMDVIDVSGAGRAVAAIFALPEKYIGKAVGLTGDRRTIQEYADILSKHLAPKTFVASEVTVEQFSQLGFPGAGLLAVMFEFYQHGDCQRDMALTKELDPHVLNFEDWVKANKDALDAAYTK